MTGFVDLSTSTLAFGFDPEIRGILSVLVGVVVLYGSVQLIVSTNTGWRLGALIAATGLMGWMFLMGITWAIYGIGLKGSEPSWQIIEINVDDLSQSGVEKIQTDPELAEWSPLEEGNPRRGDAVAASEAAVVAAAEAGILPEVFSTPSNFLPVDTGENPADQVAVLESGGKPRLEESPSRWDRIRNWVTNSLRLTHPPRHAIVQIQQRVPDQSVFPDPPDPPERDPSKPVYNVIMVRDLGDRRLPSIMVTLASGIGFAILAYMLHTRDERLKRNVAAAKASG